MTIVIQGFDNFILQLDDKLCSGQTTKSVNIDYNKHTCWCRSTCAFSCAEDDPVSAWRFALNVFRVRQRDNHVFVAGIRVLWGIRALPTYRYVFRTSQPQLPACRVRFDVELAESTTPGTGTLKCSRWLLKFCTDIDIM